MTTDVRADESIAADDAATATALGQYVATQTGASNIVVTGFSRLTGGAIQDNYALTLECTGGSHSGTQRLVVRSDAPSQVAASLTRAQEFHVLRAASQAGVTVPEPLWLSEDASIIGAPFCIMTWVPGTASGRQLVRTISTPEQARHLVQQLGEQLARLHRIAPPNDSLPFLQLPQRAPALARVSQYRHWLDAIPRKHPVLEWALNWLKDHAPDSGLRSLCHGDFRTGNYMVHEGRVSAVLDWEFASWGDPFEDLGWLCARSWRFGAPEREVGGIGDKADLYEAWERATGWNVDDKQVCYWEVMGMVRWAIIALQQGRRHLTGEQTSLELALTGRMLPEIEFDILCRIDEIEGHTTPAASSDASESANDTHAFSAPDGSNLLDTARSTLLNTLLPQLPREFAYEALMVANAMATARRELLDAGTSASATARATREFIAKLEFSASGAAAASNTAEIEGLERELAQLLRSRAVSDTHAGPLRELLFAQTRARLKLSNPKYLTGRP